MSPTLCSRCEAALPDDSTAGVCPRCAMELALEETVGSDQRGTTVDGVDRSGSRIGRYVLDEKIGQGGMGEVWLADQEEPVRRRVALKIIRPGLDTETFIARFERERQALAVMDHPAVAKMFDAGALPDGRPYLVMEYVPGEAITDYCDRRRLTTRQRLELFRAVCEGVHHAHQKAILHRDLKPSNVLVTEQDDRPIPKIIDFGVAKAIERERSDRSMFTEFGVLVGTPEYMSPEQAGADASDVDTRTDVYSLGVLLYQLLAGHLPIEPSELREAGYEGILRAIRERDPETPSSRVGQAGEHATERAAYRGTDPDSLGRQLRGDLDWITMKALDKEPDRRYASCTEFAADIERHLADEPVLAGPPSAVYRIGKFVRRHRAAVAASTAMLLLLVIGLVATTALWTIARRNRALAEERFEQIARLSDFKRVRDAREAADALWPARPALVTDLERWLEESGRPLAARLAVHEETLEDLRSRAAAYDDEQRTRDLATHPRAPELRDARDALADKQRIYRELDADTDRPDREELLADYADRIDHIETYIAELEPVVDVRRTWRFDNAQTRWQHDMLTELVEELRTFVDADPFVGTLASVESRLSFARTIAERSVEGPDVARLWSEAIEEIRSSPVYGGFEFAPQIGLVPLGPDPASGLWEFWHVGSGERPQAETSPGAPHRWRILPETGIVFVLVPGGTFWMGAQSSNPASRNFDPNAERRERAIMEVELDPFFLSKFEMTQAQWQGMTGENPSRFGLGSEWGDKIVVETNPVEMVTWNEASETLPKYGLVLPTESQWEYAARAGTTSPWWTGDNPHTLAGAANLQDSFLKANRGAAQWTYEEWLDDGQAVHAPVGSYRANPFGLHDMIGNVSEWCRDHYRSPYRTDVAPGDGYRKIPGGTVSRIARGGSYRSLAVQARLTRRSNPTPDTVEPTLGLRAARPVETPETSGDRAGQPSTRSR